MTHYFLTGFLVPAIAGRQRLESFLRRSGMATYAPLTPSGRPRPLVLKHPKTLPLGMSGRADAGFPRALGNPLPLAKTRSYFLDEYNMFGF